MKMEESYKAVFNHGEGKKVLHDLLTYCHILEPAITSNPNDILVKEGRRDVALKILKMISVDTIKFEKIVKEISNE